MPKLPPKPCTQPRCTQYATKDGRCDDHQREAWVHNGKTASERGYGAKWRKIRNRILKRDGYLCQECKRQGILANGNIVDHIINKAQSGSDDDSNLECICNKCHTIKTKHESRQGRA
jgi:5-methylcytosine-specific restriction protein A